MPNDLDVIEIELPSIFIKRVLMAPDPRWQEHWGLTAYQEIVSASAHLVADHGNRFYRDLNVPPGALTPYIYWSGVTISNRTVNYFLRNRRTMNKKVSEFTVRTLRRFPAGRATYNLSRPTYDRLMVCLTQLSYTPIYDTNDALISEISQCTWKDDHEIAYTDEKTNETVVELGIVIEMTYN